MSLPRAGVDLPQRCTGATRQPGGRRARRPAGATLQLCGCLLLLLVAACEKATHENLDHWRRTQKGPAKLRKALADPELAPDLRAHAAQNLVQLEQHAEVLGVLRAMPEAERGAVLAELAPRLWEDARIEGTLAVPTPSQAGAKDVLYELRALADARSRAVIDGYLVSWLTGGFYDGRATSGRVGGKRIVRDVGAAAGLPLLGAARALADAAPDTSGQRPRLGDELLVALALSTRPEALGFLLDLLDNDRGDSSLSGRAMAALREAYVAPLGMPPASGRALLPVLDRLERLSQRRSAPGEWINGAVDLIAAAGMPDCLPPLVRFIEQAERDRVRLWMGVQKSIRCGKAAAIVPVHRALPEDTGYERGILERYLWKEILQATPPAAAAAAARALLPEKSWVARISGAELLGLLAAQLGSEITKDIDRLRPMMQDRAALRGWWGDPRRDGTRRPEPTLGARVTEIVIALEGVAKGAKTKR
jgi:hypothetical protein